MYQILIKGGKVVSAERTMEADVAVADGKIVAVGKHLGEAVRVINAAGKYVIPGGIDPHVHFEFPFMGNLTAHDFRSGTIAAAHGGVTTVIDFAIQSKGGSLIDAIEARREKAEGKVVIDYALHSVMTDASDAALAEVKKVVEYGIPSMKVFMIYRKTGLMVDDGTLLVLLEKAREHGLLPGAHAESAAIVEYKEGKLLKEGKRTADGHALARPNITEAECINRALFLARHVGSAFYVFHMSTKEGVDLVSQARATGQAAYAETCTHYLCLTDDMYLRPDGINWIISPPLRKQPDIERMWQGLSEGKVSAIGSDECAFDTKAKSMGKESFDKTPNGAPGVEIRLPVVYSEGVRKGRLTMEQFVAATSTNAARIMGLYPQKGAIQEGSDADVVIFDPEEERTLGVKTLKSTVDWCPVEGLKVIGYPIITISRGKVIVENGEFKGQAGDGKFVKRSIPEKILT